MDSHQVPGKHRQTTCHVMSWFIIQMKQPLNNGCLEFQGITICHHRANQLENGWMKGGFPPFVPCFFDVGFTSSNWNIAIFAILMTNSWMFYFGYQDEENYSTRFASKKLRCFVVNPWGVFGPLGLQIPPVWNKNKRDGAQKYWDEKLRCFGEFCCKLFAYMFTWNLMAIHL